MNLNDIVTRLKRIYFSIGELRDVNVDTHFKVAFRPQRWFPLVLSKKDDAPTQDEIEHRVMTVIHCIAALKDHLKIAIKPQLIENAISANPSLQIAIDIDNADKHGYPVRKSRSGLDPRIEQIERLLSLKAGDNVISKIVYCLKQIGDTNKLKPVIETEETFMSGGEVEISGVIVSKDGSRITTLDILVANCMQGWERIIVSHLPY